MSLQIELCGGLSVLRLFHVSQVVRNGRGLLSLDWLEWSFLSRWKMGDLLVILNGKGVLTVFFFPAGLVKFVVP